MGMTRVSAVHQLSWTSEFSGQANKTFPGNHSALPDWSGKTRTRRFSIY